MSTSLLYHVFGIRGYRYRRTDYESGCVIVTIEQPRKSLRCPCCRADDVQRRGHKRRKWRTLSIGGKPVFVRRNVPRVHCPACGITRQVAVPFAEAQRSYTRAFERYVLQLRESMTIRDAARHLGVSWWLYREATEGLHKNVLKGTRWLLLKNPENLDEDKDERQRLQEALELNQSLATAYYLKEDLRQVWEQDDWLAAGAFLQDWCDRAWASGIRILHKFANTLAAHRTGILAWYDYPISTGPLEGTNNKIKTMKRQAYGFRDQEYFRLKLFALHKTRYQLIG